MLFSSTTLTTFSYIKLKYDLSWKKNVCFHRLQFFDVKILLIEDNYQWCWFLIPLCSCSKLFFYALLQFDFYGLHFVLSTGRFRIFSFSWHGHKGQFFPPDSVRQIFNKSRVICRGFYLPEKGPMNDGQLFLSFITFTIYWGFTPRSLLVV